MTGTSYEEIYSRYRSRVKNYELLDYDSATQLAVQQDLLEMAIDDFSDICKQNLLDRDDDLASFNITLTNQEKKILSTSMILHYVEPHVYDTDAFRNAMSTKDFSFFSPANLLEQMHSLLDKLTHQLQGEINIYSFRQADISSLTQ